jgi:hypothetical protein
VDPTRQLGVSGYHKQRPAPQAIATGRAQWPDCGAQFPVYESSQVKTADQVVVSAP